MEKPKRKKKDEEYEQRIARLVKDYEQHIVKRLNHDYVQTTKPTDRLADKIASFGGSWNFIIIFALINFIWIVWNAISLLKGFHFDEPPYMLLNFILSIISAFQAPFIMMSQNRQAERDKHESVIDYAINYKAEQKIEEIQEHMDRMANELTEIKKLLLEEKGKQTHAPIE